MWKLVNRVLQFHQKKGKFKFMSRTTEEFSKAYHEALSLAKMHNKSFWIIPTQTGYSVSCFNETSNLPVGTKTLEVKPNG